MIKPQGRQEELSSQRVALLRFSRFLLKPFQYRIAWRILPIPPTPAPLDEFLIEIHSIGQDHLPKRAPPVG